MCSWFTPANKGCKGRIAEIDIPSRITNPTIAEMLTVYPELLLYNQLIHQQLPLKPHQRKIF